MHIREQPNLAVIDDLKDAAGDAFEHGHYLESAMILFQTIESPLRMSIRRFGKARVSESSLRMAADRESSFRRLVLHLDLVYPENGLSERLVALNRQRNTLTHRLFGEFESIDALHDQVRDLCVEGMEAHQDLRSLLVGR